METHGEIIHYLCNYLRQTYFEVSYEIENALKQCINGEILKLQIQLHYAKIF